MEHRGTTITDLEQTVAKVDGIVECDACWRYFPRFSDRNEMISNVVLSSILPESEFCSEKCRDEAELAAEQARQS